MSWLNRLNNAIKAFRLGPAVVESADKFWGKDPEVFAPEAYGTYLATSTAVYACATLRAKNLASLPLKAYRMVNGEKVEITDGPLNDLMQYVNPHWTYNRLIQMTELSLCLWGQAFWVLERGPNGQGVPKEIWWARPDRMRLIPDEKDYIAGWIYEHDNERLPFRTDEVVWFRYPNPLDEYAGLSPIAATRLAIDTATGALQSNHAIFKNGLHASGVVSPSDKDTTWGRDQVEQLRENLERRFKGAANAHRLAVMGQSMSFTPITVSPKDAQFIELMKWTRGDVASAFAVPPELVGDHEHATYSNIEQAYKGFWTDCLIPEARMLADDITEQLCKLFPGVDKVEFDTAHVSALQPDKASLADQAMKWVAMGVPLNVVLSEIAPQFLITPDGYEWGNTPMAQPQPMIPDNTQPATRSIKNDQPMMKPSDFIEFGSPEHIAIWKAFDGTARRLERQAKRVVTDLFDQQAEELVTALYEQAAKAMRMRPEQKAARDQYDGIDWKPSEAVQSAFAKGVSLYEDGRGGDGLVQETVSWARRLASGESITPDKARKMSAWHARHEVDKRTGWDKEGQETPGYVAFLLWGGEPGRAWADRLVRQMNEQDRRESQKAFDSQDDIDAMWDGDYWQSVFADRMLDQIQAAAEAGGTDTFKQLKVRTDFNLATPDGNAFVNTRAQRFAERVNETTWTELRSRLSDGIKSGMSVVELEDVVRETMGDRIRSSAETIARTEMIGALNGGALLGAEQSGVPARKNWIAALDPDTRESHVQAHVQYQASPIDLAEPFQVGDGEGPAPGQIGLPEEDINCRCAIGWAVDLAESRNIDHHAIDRLKRFVEG